MQSGAQLVTRPRRVLVVIPCFNEETTLPQLVAELREMARGRPEQFEFLVIDDGSFDGTLLTARELGVRSVRLCSNLGIGAAVQTGLRVACEEGFDCAVQLDGDGQHPPAQLPLLLARLDEDPEPDLVLGSRFIFRGEGGRTGFRSTAARRMGIRWLSLVLRLAVRLKVTDPTSGFRLFGHRALALFDQTFPYDYPEPEALSLAQLAGLRVVEEPVVMRERRHGQSSISGLGPAYYMLKVTLALLLDVVRNSRRMKRRERRWKSPSVATGSLPPSSSALPSPSSASSRGSA